MNSSSCSALVTSVFEHSASRPNRLLRARESFLVATADRDERTFGDEALRQSETESVGAARDEKCPVLNFEIHGCILGIDASTAFHACVSNHEMHGELL